MSGHGPDCATFDQASNAELQPRYLDDTLAFMFETRLVLRPTKFAMDAPQRQRDYWTCWQGLRKHFSPD
jgi:homogentisate 1,2-dioxygenase